MARGSETSITRGSRMVILAIWPRVSPLRAGGMVPLLSQERLILLRRIWRVYVSGITTPRRRTKAAKITVSQGSHAQPLFAATKPPIRGPEFG